jgi:Holliday junction resolvasome RuvABC endonuclease subunit
MSESVLSIDIGTKTGWALHSLDGSILSGTEVFKLAKNEGAGMRYLKFNRWLVSMLNSDINIVYYEKVMRHIGVEAAHVYGGLVAILLTWCEKNNIPYEGVHVATIKKHATGNGKASKEDMIKAMTEKGHTPVDDNEADALSLLYYSLDIKE